MSSPGLNSIVICKRYIQQVTTIKPESNILLWFGGDIIAHCFGPKILDFNVPIVKFTLDEEMSSLDMIGTF